MTSTKPTPETGPTWPYRSLLLYGTFGGNTPAGERYRRRAFPALFLWVLVQMSAAWVPRQYHGWYWPTLGITFAYIGWEWWRYLESLEELERKIQMEAAAWTYVVAIAVGATLAGIAMNLGWRVNPAYIGLVEGIRPLRLYQLTRRYQ